MRRRFVVVTSGAVISLGLVAGCGGRGIPRTAKRHWLAVSLACGRVGP